MPIPNDTEINSSPLEKNQLEKIGASYDSLMTDVMDERDSHQQHKKTGEKMQMSEDEIRKEFKETDKDGDGYIDFVELVAHENGDKAKAKIHFDDGDSNKDGKIDEGEWLWHHMNSPLHRDSNGTMKM